MVVELEWAARKLSAGKIRGKDSMGTLKFILRRWGSCLAIERKGINQEVERDLEISAKFAFAFFTQ